MQAEGAYASSDLEKEAASRSSWIRAERWGPWRVYRTSRAAGAVGIIILRGFLSFVSASLCSTGFSVLLGGLNVLKNVQPQDREQQLLRMTSHATCWELEFASGNQQPAAFTVRTLPVAGRAATVRKLKTRRAQPRRRRGQKKQSKQNTWRRSGTRCKWKVKKDPWAGMGMDEADEAPLGIPAKRQAPKERAHAGEAEEETRTRTGKTKMTPGLALAWTMPT